MLKLKDDCLSRWVSSNHEYTPVSPLWLLPPFSVRMQYGSSLASTSLVCSLRSRNRSCSLDVVDGFGTGLTRTQFNNVMLAPFERIAGLHNTIPQRSVRCLKTLWSSIDKPHS